MSIKKFICTAALVAFIGVSAGGCYGKYALFNMYKDFNGSMGNKFIVALVHFVSWVVPIYPICLFADYLIFNTIEFWTGSNPVAMGETYEETDGNGNKIYAVRNADGTLSVRMVDSNGNEANFTLVRDEFEVRALNAEGVVIAQQNLPYHNNYMY